MSKIVKSFNSWEDLKTAEDFFQAMVNFEHEAGEDFIDQNESFLLIHPFLQWLRGKGIVSTELYNYILENKNKELFGVSLQSFLSAYDDDCSIFPFGESDDDAHYKGFQFMAEYCVGLTALRKRMCNNILHAYDYHFHDDEDEEDYDDRYWTIEEERWNEIHKIWENIQKITVEDINKRLEKRK